MAIAHTPDGTPIHDYIPPPLSAIAPDRLLTKREAAERLSVSVASITNAIKRGDLEVRRIGRAVRIPAAALATFGESGTARPVIPEPVTYTPRPGKRPYRRVAAR